MDEQVDLACTTCGEEFQVPSGIYERHSDVVFCPCCGSTDLLLPDEAGGTGARAGDAAA